MRKGILGLLAWGWSATVFATPISIDFFGVQLTVAGEYINAVPVPVGLAEFAPLFGPGQTVTGSIAYDTNQPDVDPDPNVGTYLIGTLSVQIPELGLSISRFSNFMQISSFNDTPNPDDQFFAYTNGFDSFLNSAGIPGPISFDVLLTGGLSMLSGDQLPTSALDWTYGNVSFDFIASDGSERQVLLTFSPAPPIPEPTTVGLLALGLAGLGFRTYRRRA